MSLEDWEKYGWLKAEPTSRDEIKGLLKIIERDLKDANVGTISDDRRFEAAFNAARTAATAALRAAGYRVPPGAGQHVKTIESLEFTLKVGANLIQRMRVLGKKRNATSYDTADNVSKQELELSIKTAKELRASTLEWLQMSHAELLKD